MPDETPNFIKGVFEVVNARSLEDVFKEQARNMSVAIEQAEEYLRDLESEAFSEGITAYDLAFAIDTRWVDDWVWKRTFIACVENIQEKAILFLSTEAVKAIVASEEFNYDLYVDHFLTALEIHEEEIIGIIPHESTKQVQVKINLDVLGKVEDWGRAIEAYRTQSGLGKIKATALDKDKAAKVSSKIWKEKIYGVGREGVSVSKYFKKVEQRRDVTERYRGKYRETVFGRLSNIPGGQSKAPFWYLIEHGNANVDMGIDTDGVPYPVYGPTHFRRNAEIAILEAFRQLWEIYSRIAQEFLDDLAEKIREEEERDWIETPIETVYEKVEREVFEETVLIVAKAIEEGTPVGRGMLAQAETDIGRFEGYQREWGTQVSRRDPRTGQWAKLPSNWD